jgi:hypothetical protein
MRRMAADLEKAGGQVPALRYAASIASGNSMIKACRKNCPRPTTR